MSQSTFSLTYFLINFSQFICTMATQLGVNGYAFIVNNNGYVLTHPDFRPTVRIALNAIATHRRSIWFNKFVLRFISNAAQFQDILKPAYNIVDMLEVELLDDDSEPRAFSEQLLQVWFCADWFSIHSKPSTVCVCVFLTESYFAHGSRFASKSSTKWMVRRTWW